MQLFLEKDLTDQDNCIKNTDKCDIFEYIKMKNFCSWKEMLKKSKKLYKFEDISANVIN